MIIESYFKAKAVESIPSSTESARIESTSYSVKSPTGETPCHHHSLLQNHPQCHNQHNLDMQMTLLEGDNGSDLKDIYFLLSFGSHAARFSLIQVQFFYCCPPQTSSRRVVGRVRLQPEILFWVRLDIFYKTI